MNKIIPEDIVPSLVEGGLVLVVEWLIQIQYTFQKVSGQSTIDLYFLLVLWTKQLH